MSRVFILVAVLSFGLGLAWAHGPENHKAEPTKQLESHNHGASVGEPGDARLVSRVIAVAVEPGKTGEIVWKFTKNGTFEFGCLIPGHYEAGMVGKLNVAM